MPEKLNFCRGVSGSIFARLLANYAEVKYNSV